MRVFAALAATSALALAFAAYHHLPAREPAAREPAACGRACAQREAAPLPSVPAAGFVENRGQFDERALFRARQGDVSAWLTRDGFALTLPPTGGAVRGANVFLRFESARADALVEGVEPLPGRHHFLRGGASVRDASAFASVRYRGLYDGVDLELTQREGRIEYDLALRPGVDASAIRIRCEGAERLALDGDGQLVVATAAGELRQGLPRTHELLPSGERRPLAARFALLGAEPSGSISARAIPSSWR